MWCISVTIKSTKDLTTVFNLRIIKALELTRDEIFKIILKKVTDYYEEQVFNPPNESEPDYYNRTRILLKSLTASHIKMSKNNYEFTVGWNDEYLTFRYPGGFAKNGSAGTFNKATGLQVLNWFNSESHGGTVDGSHRYFDEAIDELGGKEGIVNILKSNMKKCGFSIK